MISVEDVTKSYQRGSRRVPVLRGVSCEIPTGSFSVILGPSGSGKSTLLYLLGALDRPDGGSIRLGGRDLNRLSESERNRLRQEDIGFIFQSFNLLSNLAAVDNVLVPAIPSGITASARREASELLDRLGLGDRLDHKPSELSGGEQQRVAIARALLKRPKYVFADEPTGELDSERGAEVIGLLRDLQDELDATVVVVTHDRRYLRDEDTLLEMGDGVLVGQRTHVADAEVTETVV